MVDVVSLKRSHAGDDGVAPLSTSSLLQMAGRAGRRGKDAAGTVVLTKNRRQGEDDAALARKILLGSVAPIDSKFAPSYGLACALLEGGDVSACRAVVERSFGTYLASKRRRKAPAKRQRRDLTCAGEDEADVRDYVFLLDRASEACDRYEAALAAGDDDAAQACKTRLRGAQEAVLASPIARLDPSAQAAAVDAFRALEGGEVVATASEDDDTDVDDVDAYAATTASEAWVRFERLVTVLSDSGALADGRPTNLGRLVANIRGDNELLLALCLTHGATATVAAEGSVGEFAALCSALVNESGDKRNAFVDHGPSKTVRRATDALWDGVLLPLSDAQYAAGLDGADASLSLDDSAAGLVEAWADGASWAQIAESTSLDHGDLIRLFRRTLDVLKTTAALPLDLAPDAFAHVAAAARSAADAVDRPPVRDDQFDAIFVADDDDDDDGDEEAGGAAADPDLE